MGSGTTSLRLAALLALTFLLTVNAAARQRSQTRAKDSPQIASEKRSGSNFHSSFSSSAFALGGAVVKGAPFSAVAVSETVQALSDGTSVTRRRTARVYRDAEGSVRIERGPGEGVIGSLYDAASGATYMLSSRHRMALQFSPPADAPARQAKIITPQSPPDNVGDVAGETIEPLGTRVIEGVKAEGVRVTSAVPGGRVVYERWYSQELRRDVLVRCTDPRFGEAVYQLTDLKLAEPSPELFVVPAGYKVEKAVFGKR